MINFLASGRQNFSSVSCKHTASLDLTYQCDHVVFLFQFTNASDLERIYSYYFNF